MKSILTILVLALAFPTVASAFEAPRGLRWGTPWDSVIVDIRKLPREKQFLPDKPKKHKHLPTGFTGSKIKKIKLLKEKADEAYLIFDSTDGLCAVQYAFIWDNVENPDNMFDSPGKGRAKAWEYAQKLVYALKSKYGDPESDQINDHLGEKLTSGLQFSAKWLDQESGNSIIAVVTRKYTNAVIAKIDRYAVVLQYSTPNYIEEVKKEAIDVDEL